MYNNIARQLASLMDDKDYINDAFSALHSVQAIVVETAEPNFARADHLDTRLQL